MLRELDFSKHSVSEFRFGSKETFLQEIMDASQLLVRKSLDETLA